MRWIGVLMDWPESDPKSKRFIEAARHAEAEETEEGEARLQETQSSEARRFEEERSLANRIACSCSLRSVGPSSMIRHALPR